MKYLHNDNYYEEVNKLFENNDELDIAVAFLGYGSKLLFDVNKNINKKIRVICNFESGACNPNLVEQLIRYKNITIKSYAHLHAKTLIQNSSVIIGSANLSANGLSLEGAELTAWAEVGILLNDDKVISESKSWFEDLWNKSSLITVNEIQKQKVNWRKRRKSRPFIEPENSKNSLIETALSGEQLTDREIYFAIYYDFASVEAETTFQEIKFNEKTHDLIDFYEDWLTLPDNANLISIHVGPRGGIEIDGLFETPENPITQQFINANQKTSSIKICFSKSEIEGYKLSINDMKMIKQNFKYLLNANKSCQPGEAYVVSLYDWIAEIKKNLTKT